MGCTTSAPVEEDARGRKGVAPAKQPPPLNGQAFNGVSEEIKAHPPGVASAKLGDYMATSKAEVSVVAHPQGSTISAAPNSKGPLLQQNAPSAHKAQPAEAATDTAAQNRPDRENKPKERRQAVGAEVIRDELRKKDNAVGGDVSDSSDDEPDEHEPQGSAPSITMAGSRSASMIHEPKTAETIERISAALSKQFVFKGIDTGILQQVVLRMFKVQFEAGATVLEQGAVPKSTDCLYFLDQGEVDIVIAGSGEAANVAGEERKVEGQKIIVHKTPGWVFGDIALLFNSPRSASIEAATSIQLWAMERRVFLKFVMKHAPGARALRFVRRLPLLKGLSDNMLISVAERMGSETFEDGTPLIKYGERGDKLYLIRYGKVKVLRPDDKGGRIEVAKLGRGSFVGERALIAGKMRSADCVAEGHVEAVVMNKKDFMDLDNPLLNFMLDYDAVAALTRFSNIFKGVTQEKLDDLVERFVREEFHAGEVIVKEGDPLSKMYVVRVGEVTCTSKGKVLPMQEAGGFSRFGEQNLVSNELVPYTVTVQSDLVVCLSLSRRAFMQLMGHGPAVTGLSSEDAASAGATLMGTPQLKGLSDSEFKSLVSAFELREYGEGDVIAWAADAGDSLYIVKSGECVLTTAVTQSQKQQVQAASPGEQRLPKSSALPGDRLKPGDKHGEQALLEAQPRETTLVALKAKTQVMVLTKDAVENLMGQQLKALLQQRAFSQSSFKKQGTRAAASKQPKVEFEDLEMHRIIGTGQFGLVRIVRHMKTNEVYALKVMHKAPIQESKQVEHVVNERRILEEATHQFCVGLVRPFQDKTCLYLLQEWVGGGELFHHLDLEGAFDEPTAMFYAANVLLALEHLHQHGIVYRDLKPENLLLDAQGYCKVADFGFAKKILDEKTYTICGTPDYQAPEVIMRKGTTKAADYWALGVLIFEMLVGDPPFKSLSGDPWDTFRRTLSGRFYVPNFISESAADLIYKLLQVNPERRLGSGPTGADEIKRHKWFSRLDWQALEEKKLPAPIQPKISKPLDTSNFDVFDNVDPPAFAAGKADRNAHVWNELWDWIEEPPQ